MTTLAVLGVAFLALMVLMLIVSRGTQRAATPRHHMASDGTMAFGDGGSSDCGSDGGGGCGDGGGGGGD